MTKVYFQNFKVIPFPSAEVASEKLELLQDSENENASIVKLKSEFLDPNSQGSADVFVVTNINHRGHLVVHDNDGAFVFSTESPEANFDKYFEKVDLEVEPTPNRPRPRLK